MRKERISRAVCMFSNRIAISGDDNLSPASSSSGDIKLIIKTDTIKRGIKLPSFSEACDHTDVSDRALAFISSSLLQSVGSIKESNKSIVIDQNKICKARKRIR